MNDESRADAKYYTGRDVGLEVDAAEDLEARIAQTHIPISVIVQQI